MSRQLRILLAEDNEDHAFLTMRALRGPRGELALLVEAVYDGEEALDYLYRRGEYADRPRPDIIILDLKMPRRDGFEVLEVIKSDPGLREIPVIVLTSSDRDEDVRRGYRLGSNSYVVKPITSDDLVERVRELPGYWARVNTLPPRSA